MFLQPRIILLVLHATVATGHHFTYSSSPVVSTYAQFVVTLLDRHYASKYSSTLIGYCAKDSISNSYLQRDVLDRMLLHKPPEIALKFGTPTELHGRRYYYNLFLIDGYQAFRTITARLDPVLHEFTGYYMMVVTSLYNLENHKLQQMFTDLWALNIINVVIITTGFKDESSDFRVYTYFPYVENYCGHAHPVLLYQTKSNYSLIPAVNIFPYKLANFQRCPIYVASFDYPPYTIIQSQRLIGVKGDMLNEIAQRLNFSLHVVPVQGDMKWGVIYGNDTTTGAVRMVLDEAVNLTAGSFSLRAERSALMKPSVSYYTIRIIFTVPPGRPYTAFEKLFRPFAANTWTMISLLLLFGLTVIYTLKFYSRPIRNFVYGRTVLMPALNMLNIFFGGSSSRTPGRNFARTLLFLWLYYCFVMRSLYQSSLFEYLQQKKNYTHLDTLKRIEAEQMPYWMSPGAVIFVSGLKYILKRTTFISDKNELVTEAFHRQSTTELQVAILATFDHVAYYNERFYKRGIVHVTRDTILRQPIGLYYPKKSCLTGKFDTEIGKIQMVGLFDYWLHQYVGYRFFTRRRRDYNPLPTVLTNEHLLGCYQVLLCSLGIACGVFGLELLSTRCRRLKRLLEFLM
ncbi:uncharacterized protein LOC129716593 [Wyeomyia smithii]|uniref:uncharacterized protein LOC129716593 n=1 Tax=Wyeomyia smithii TaxID=174621 RepID=UPI002467D46A|nr:uncharacterized protein LOC129716593 [Wyeomyia smithii]